jgi:hypothetical protein
MERGQIRQGDVLLVPVDVEPPPGLEPQREIVLALGEATGHAHRLTGAVVEWTQAGERYVRSFGPGSLSHEEHDPTPAVVVLPDVTYRVVQQREWDLSGQWRKVVD